MISKYLGFDSDYIIIGLAVLVVILLVLWIVNIVQIKSLKKNYKVFMSGKNAKTLEDTLIKRLDEVEHLLKANAANEKNIKKIFANMKYTYQKIGLVKYDAFHEMGGKLSFSLALLNETNDGFVLNAVHSREGCYTYIKEIIDGNSVLVLAEEEQEALDMAKNSRS
ncbi:MULTISPECIES: DUF4446 family protein [Agathobacter]|uniref:DUF4446 domain-containing protein n=1 Tax=Agathobacter ruminis TaxID=1712665 RepID=A0A2G3E552_9FIRM|nr:MULTISPECIES: DUF4446 family protein [Agathobacter]MBQ1682094.1 DUF4446 family protein [Agathobacter sp.]MCR5677178.1 DUF4446 family protein [Agathobacter sp.]MDC7302322.1 DUF4446 family protein [Agathobacter ruminis]PHU38406.1 hypothetical protein CSX02_02985 [Agathobacter ruminis]